ncbi:DHHC palmitoyltransferase-domain-containing protein [Chytridium lagenaria]|nr:DHHC palmitoyltransferase-domain-containing protein [Chytridium lagenaria]
MVICSLHMTCQQRLISTGVRVAIIALFQPTAVLFVWSYYMIIVTDPGFPNAGLVEESNTFRSLDQYQPYRHLRYPFFNAERIRINWQKQTTGNTEWEISASTDVPSSQGVEIKRDGRRRFCRKCHNFKPDRTHHCSTCNRCVLKMDHIVRGLIVCWVLESQVFLSFRVLRVYVLFVYFLCVYGTALHRYEINRSRGEPSVRPELAPSRDSVRCFLLNSPRLCCDAHGSPPRQPNDD